MRFILVCCNKVQCVAIKQAAVKRDWKMLEVSGISALLRVVGHMQADCIVLDVTCDRTALGVIVRKLRHQEIKAPIIAINVCGSSQQRIEVLESGADDCIPEPLAVEELFARMRNVVRRTESAVAQRCRVALKNFGLTNAERRLASLLLEGTSLRDIATHLRLSPHTLRCQLRSIFKKTGTNRQAELVSFLLNGASGIVEQGMVEQ